MFSSPGDPTKRLSAARLARVIGALFLVLLFVGPVAIVVLPAQIQEYSAPATQQGDWASLGQLLRVGLCGDLVIILTELFMIPALYLLFAPVDAFLSLAAAFLRLGMVIVMVVNSGFYVTAITAVVGRGTIGRQDEAFAGYRALEQFSANHALGVKVWEIPFGMHCAVLGLLVRRSGFVGGHECLFGGLLGLAALGYLLDGIAGILVGGSKIAAVCETVGGIMNLVGELPFFLWVLLRGVDDDGWSKLRNHDEPADLLLA